MERAINLKRKDGKIKVVAPKTEQFLVKAHEFHGTWREPAWWFDDTYIDPVKDLLMKEWNVDGEEEYEECTLYVRRFSATGKQAPVYLFNRLIAQSFGHGHLSKIGPDINLIFGRYKVGGTFKYWTTEVIDATFEINRFPLPATYLPPVKAAVAGGWCVIKREGGTRTREIVQADLEVCQFNLDRYQRELRIFDGLTTKYIA